MKKKVKKKKLRRPTRKQVGVLTEIVEQIKRGEEINISKAGRKVGYKDRTSAHRGIQSPTIMPILKDFILGCVSDGDLARAQKAIKEGLSAETVKIASHEGMITDERSYPDFPTRRLYTELFLKLIGFLKGDSGDMSQLHLHLHKYENSPDGELIGSILEQIATRSKNESEIPGRDIKPVQ